MAHNYQPKVWTDNYSKFNTLDSDDSGDEEDKNSANKNAFTQSADGSKDVVSLEGSPVLSPTHSFDFASDTDFASTKARVRSFPQNGHEVWQIICHRLGCWTSVASESADDIPLVVRPWAVSIACIYPEEGRLLGYDISSAKPYDLPTIVDIFHRLLELMRDPPFGNQRRPGKIVCDNSAMGDDLYFALASIKIECALMSAMPEAIKLHGASITNIICKAGGARPEDSSLMPRLFDTQLALHQSFMTASSRLLLGPSEPPWLCLPPDLSSRHFVVALTLHDFSGENLTLGSMKGDTVWLGFLHDDDGILGLAIFWSRLDCEARMKDPDTSMQSVRRNYDSYQRCAYQHHLNLAHASEPITVKLKRTKPRSFDVRNGVELCYENAVALKSHWPYVRAWSLPLEDRILGIENDRKYWHPRGEAVLLFREQTSICFEDHEYLDKHKLQYLDPVSTMKLPTFLARADKLGKPISSFFPAPIALNHGGKQAAGISACDSQQLSWLTLAASIAVEVPALLSQLQHVDEVEQEVAMGTCSAKLGISLDPVLIHGVDA